LERQARSATDLEPVAHERNFTCDIIVGVDTHKHIHAAVAITALGARLGT
jgi:hypothetical protein